MLQRMKSIASNPRDKVAEIVLPKAKRAVRRTAWIIRNLFWSQLFPVASGIASSALNTSLRSALPQTSSPFLTGHLLRVQTVDGAVMAAIVPTKAYAKYALPKGLPADGKVLAIENDPHFVDDFDGVIEDGYGKGIKTLLLSDSVIVKVAGRTSVQKINYHVHDAERAGKHFDIVVTGIKPGTKQWELNIPRGEFKGRYAFVKTNGAMICTRMKDQGLQMAKPDYTLRTEERLQDLDASKVIVERKIDGSLGNAHVKDYRVTFRSHREGGETYYDKLPAIEFINNQSPFLTSRLVYAGPALNGTVFQGELAHSEGAARVSGILNSLAPNARAIQEERGPVKYYVWDVLRFRGRDVSGRPYAERRALAERLVREIRFTNKNWDIVEKCPDGELPAQFYQRVINSPLPWGEGIVIKPRDASAQKWDKMKMTGFGYFKLVDILPGEGKYGNSVGRLLVENPENGARGEVGSLAVPDEFRNWMWTHRDDLRGQTIKVRSQEVTSRGVPRAGVFYGFHDSEVGLLMTAEAQTAGTGRDYKEAVYAMKSAAGWRRK